MNPFEDLGEELVKRIKEELVKKNLNDQGGASDSLDFFVYDNIVTIEGIERIMFLEYGRRPTQQTGKGDGDKSDFVEAIRGWATKASREN